MNKTIEIKPEDLKVGMKITVLENIGTGKCMMRSYIGQIYEVKAISLPFVSMYKLDHYEHNQYMTEINTNEHIIGLPTEEYINSATCKN